ncbi:hypothetical protein DFH06DRAFT_105049 [Mycena polygramma]|nr:hypothetical protein DFH06DRAFT_105049 [Mycena polygramma]
MRSRAGSWAPFASELGHSARMGLRNCARYSLPPRAEPRISANPCVWYAQARSLALALACALSARSIGCVARCIDPLALGSAFGCWYTSFALWLYAIARGAGIAAAPICPAAVARRLLAAAWRCRPATCAASPYVMRHSARQVASARKCRYW